MRHFLRPVKKIYHAIRYFLRPVKKISYDIRNFFLRPVFKISSIFRDFILKTFYFFNRFYFTLLILFRSLKYTFYLYADKKIKIHKFNKPEKTLSDKNSIALILAVSTGNKEPRFLRQCETLHQLNINPLILGQPPNPDDNYSNPNYSFFRIKNNTISSSSNYSSLIKHYLIFMVEMIQFL